MPGIHQSHLSVRPYVRERPPRLTLDLDTARATFDASTDFTVGLEEEFGILDPETLELVPRFEDLRGAGHPVAQRRARQLHPVPGQPAHLAVERDVVDVFVGGHMSQQPGTGKPLSIGWAGLPAVTTCPSQCRQA